jgi:hypothetical protein
VYQFSDHTGSLLMSWGQTRILADHGTVYLHLKTKTTKNRKRLSQDSKNFLKLTLWPIVNLRLTRLYHAFLLAYFFDYRLLFSPSADFPADHRPITLTNWPTVRAEPFWPSANLIDRSTLPLVSRLYSAFHHYFSLSLLTYFSKK